MSCFGCAVTLYRTSAVSKVECDLHWSFLVGWQLQCKCTCHWQTFCWFRHLACNLHKEAVLQTWSIPLHNARLTRMTCLALRVCHRPVQNKTSSLLEAQRPAAKTCFAQHSMTVLSSHCRQSFCPVSGQDNAGNIGKSSLVVRQTLLHHIHKAASQPNTTAADNHKLFDAVAPSGASMAANAHAHALRSSCQEMLTATTARQTSGSAATPDEAAAE